jgi:4'-phosphopantetheinyl transferase
VGVIEPGQVHVACGRVAALLASAPAPEAWLSPGEGARLAHMASATRRRQFLAARWQARVLLAQAAGGAAAAWRLTAASNAPPAVEARPGWRISVSHSGDWAAAALALAPVGLDLEAPRRRRDIDGLIAMCCTDAEQAMFAPLEAGAREALFYEIWTVKESWLKQRLEGITPGRLREIGARPGPQGTVRTWRGEGHWLALCAPHAARVRWWSAQPAALRRWRVS